MRESQDQTDFGQTDSRQRGGQTGRTQNGHSGSAFAKLCDLFVPQHRGKRAVEEQNERLEAFLRAVPLEYCGWDEKGLQAISPGFATLLGAANIENFQDVQNALTAGDAAALESLYDRLRSYGETFELAVQTVTVPGSGLQNRALKLFGKRGVFGDAEKTFCVLWALDISDLADAAQRSAQAISTVEKRESELRSSLNSLPFPVWIRNTKLDISWCNRFYAKSVDDTPAAVVADQRELPLTGASKGETTQRILSQRALSRLAPEAMRGHMVIEGERKLVEIIEIPIPQEKRTIGIALDVTREEEWQKTCDRLISSHRETLEHLRTAIAMFDADARLDFYNAAYEQMTGLSGVWLDAKPKITEIIDKMRELRRLPEQADYKQFKQNWLQRFTSLLEPQEEMQYLPDGSVLRQIVMPRPTGGLLMTLEDVTSRLRLETSYNTLMAVQEETINNLAEGIAVFGEDGRLRLSNKAFSDIWRLEDEKDRETLHISRLVELSEKFFLGHDWADAKRIILGNALEREPRKGRLRLAAGSVLEYLVVPLPDGNILNAWTDITDTVNVENALIEKNRALEEAERLKTDFLANVSYQLRTPLNAIMGFAEMLNMQYFGALNERQMEYTASVIEAGQRLVSLVNDILDLSTIDAGYMKLYPADIRLSDMVAQVVQLTQEWAKKQGVEIIVDCPDAGLAFIADERRVKQVLLNLISNAINYSPGGGRVTISVRGAADQVLLSVSDTGMGIPQGDLARVFTPFERISSGKTQRRSGAGLGLALVKSIVELHGGKVSIESREGEGTLVTCIFKKILHVQKDEVGEEKIAKA